MPSLSERARRAARTGHLRRLARFAGVSVVSTAVTQLVLFLTFDVLVVSKSAMVCNVIATACATVPAYWLNRTWTWGKRGRSDPWREVVPFWAIAFVGLVLSTLSVGFAQHHAGAITSSDTMRRIIIQVANLATYAVIWVARYLIFNRYLFGEHTQQVAQREAFPHEEDEVIASPAGVDSI